MKKISIRSLRDFAKKHESKIIGKYGRSSVLIPIVDICGDLNILFEVRSENLSTQPGEVSFPGGKMERNETPEETAVRETCEELGLVASDIEVLGELDRIRAYSNFTMYSFLGAIDHDAVINADFNRVEVKEIFFVPLGHFLENEPYIYEYDIIPDIGDDFPYEKIRSKDGYNWRKGRSVIPIYEYEGHVIWGLTARMVLNLIENVKLFLT